MIVWVVDAGDARLDAFRWRERRLASRSERADGAGAGLFIAEGDLVVLRALATGHVPVSLLCGEECAGELSAAVADEVCVFVGDDPLRREVTGLGVAPAMAGLFRRPAPRGVTDTVGGRHFVVAAEAIDNPTNLGALVRSAAALGWDALLLDPTSADPLSRRALRVSMGAGLALPFARITPGESLVDELHRYGFAVLATTPDPGARSIDTVDPTGAPVALLLGSERGGLTAGLLAAADTCLRIPMHHGTDSLNVAAAAAIALHRLGPNGDLSRRCGDDPRR